MQRPSSQPSSVCCTQSRHARRVGHRELHRHAASGDRGAALVARERREAIASGVEHRGHGTGPVDGDLRAIDGRPLAPAGEDERLDQSGPVASRGILEAQAPVGVVGGRAARRERQREGEPGGSASESAPQAASKSAASAAVIPRSRGVTSCARAVAPQRRSAETRIVRRDPPCTVISMWVVAFGP